MVLEMEAVEGEAGEDGRKTEGRGRVGALQDVVDSGEDAAVDTNEGDVAG